MVGDVLGLWSGCGSDFGQFLDDLGKADGDVIESFIEAVQFGHARESSVLP
jgi:hypothetical protein